MSEAQAPVVAPKQEEKKPAAPAQQAKPAAKGIGLPGDGFKHSARRPSQQDLNKANPAKELDGYEALKAKGEAHRAAKK